MIKKSLFSLVLLLSTLSLWSMSTAERQQYLQWMKQSLPDVPAWTAWQQKTGELPPDFDQLPRTNLLPDPLRFLDGRPVRKSDADWKARRAEILGLFEKYMTGTFPPKPAISKVAVLDETQGAGYLTRNVQIFFGPEGKGSVRARLVIPQVASGKKMPVMMSPSLDGWASNLVRRGYISAGDAGDDFMDDGGAPKGFYPALIHI